MVYIDFKKIQEILKPLPYVRVCIRPSIHSSGFYINLNILFMYKDIFTKFADNVYGYENMSVQNFGLILKTKGHHSQLFENHKDALNVELLQLASSHFPLPLLLGVWDVKRICRKSRSGNLSQVLNFTFDPCFKVKWGHHTKASLFLPYYWC